MKKASEVARGLIFGRCAHPKEKLRFVISSSNYCLDCCASAIREQVKEALEEAEKDVIKLRQNADPQVRMLGLGYPKAINDAIQAIRKLIQEVE